MPGVHGQAGADPERNIVVCIDDVGMHEGVNRAALDLARAGRASALSLLVGAPAFDAAADALRRSWPPGADVGLHLDLCEFPLQPALRERRRGLGQWMLRALFGGAERALIHAELGAQLERFESRLGRMPDFIDGHRHVHQLPGVREVVIEWLGTLPAAQRPWVRNSRPRTPPWSPKAWLIGRAGAGGLESLARAAGVRQNARLLGIHDFRGGVDRYEARVARWLHAAHEGDLLMCHPSDPLPAVQAAADALHDARCAEGAFWASARAGALLGREGVRVRRLRETGIA